MLRDVTNATMTAAQTKMVDKHLSTAGSIFRKIAGSTLRQLENSPKTAQLIEQFNNTYVRKGQMIPDSRKHVMALQRWIQTKYKAEGGKEVYRCWQEDTVQTDERDTVILLKAKYCKSCRHV